MSINRNALFKEILNNFLEVNKEVEAIIVSDEEGFIIAGEKRKDIDIELISFLTAVVNPILERIRTEFSFKKFGTASFDTDQHRLLFISVDEKTTLSLALEIMCSIDKVSPYAYFLAEKTAQILIAKEGEVMQLEIPNFEYEGQTIKDFERLKNQIYQSKLDRGCSFRFKFIVLGDHQVGKTSIIRRFVEKKFNAEYRTTIGLNILSYNFEAFGNSVNLHLWDIGAQEFFKRYRKTYYNGAQAAFIVFDLTNKDSFKNVVTWHNELKEFIENKDIPIIIVGNKKDKTQERLISYDEGVKLAKDLSEVTNFSDSCGLSKFADLSELNENVKTKISYIETSALTGDHIEDAFSLISYHYMIKIKELEEERLKNSILDEISSILEDNKSLTLAFLTEDPLWSPGLQILTEIKKLGNYQKVKDKNTEKQYQYPSGLIVKSYTYGSFKISDCDGVFCIFDARQKDHVDSSWKDNMSKILDKINKNKVILIGIRISEDVNWSRLIDEFDFNKQAEEKMVSLLFFKIGEEYRLEIFEQLKVMLDSIKNLLFNY